MIAEIVEVGLRTLGELRASGWQFWWRGSDVVAGGRRWWVGPRSVQRRQQRGLNAGYCAPPCSSIFLTCVAYFGTTRMK
jgi:hypothetical protein